MEVICERRDESRRAEVQSRRMDSRPEENDPALPVVAMSG